MSLLSQISLRAFIEENQIRTEAGDVLDFKKYRFMEDIYNDRSSLICCKKCLDPNTKVLTSNLRWKKLGNISVGDKLLSVDEFELGSKQGRRFRTATIEAKWESFQEAYRIILEDGRTLTASAEHQFLARKYTYNTTTVWKSVSEMKPGDMVRHIVTPWGESNFDDGWFGGIIDGEGHIRTQSGVQIDIVQNPGEISDKIESYLKQSGVKFRKDLRDKKSAGNNRINCFEVSGTEDSMRLFGKCQPVKLLRNQSIFDNKKVGGVGRSWVKVLSIEPIGRKKLVDIQTSTRTFIAEGIVTHNCAQIGFTTYQILKSAHQCKFDKIDLIYVLPTADDVKKFSGGKTNKILAQNPIMQTWTKDKDSVEQKQFGDNTVYYQGSWTERAALMITAKKLIVDEYDRCKPDIVEQYDSRLQSIADPQKAFFSNPSIPDFGVDKLYKLSDQKKWHITHSCGETYVMDESCVDYNQKKYICPKCKGEIIDEERRLGEWIATSTGEWSGYWIPLWIAPWMPASRICEAKRTKSPEFFANFVAGEPFVGGGNKVSAQTIISCLSDITNAQEDRVIIGVDTGLPIHYVLGNKQGFFYYGKCSDPSTGKDPYLELEALLKRFEGSIIIADQGGDLIGIRSLQAKYPGRVFLVWYRADKSGTEMIKWGENEEYGKVSADRNRLIQLFIDEMLDKRVTFNGTKSDWQDYIVHWMNIYRTWDENALGIRVFKWERQGPDHWVHATIYARIGLDRYSKTMAKVVGSDFMSELPIGRFFQ